MQNLKGNVAIITGASSGLGEAAARLLVAEGVNVVLAARRGERMDALVEELGDKATAIAADVGEREQIAALFDQVRQRFGGLNLLVNNAGVGINGPFADTDLEDWKT